jgi:hypothetical protein
LKKAWSFDQETWPNIEADRDYWTNPDMTVAKIRAKYNLKSWKQEPVGLCIICPDCGREDEVWLRNKHDVRRAEKWKCPYENCPTNELRMPFGMFKGLTIAEVYQEQPSYLAWFLDVVEPDRAEVRRIRAEIEKLPGIEKHLEKYRQKQLQAQWTQRSQLSPAAIDDLCDRLFNGE